MGGGRDSSFVVIAGPLSSAFGSAEDVVGRPGRLRGCRALHASCVMVGPDSAMRSGCRRSAAAAMQRQPEGGLLSALAAACVRCTGSDMFEEAQVTARL